MNFVCLHPHLHHHIRVPALSRTKIIFQDFPDLDILQTKFQDFPGGVGILQIKFVMCASISGML